MQSDWPDVADPVKLHKTARQIAGLANAARGNPITGIIGLDEDAHTITGTATDVEAANRWPVVQRRFAGGIGPELDTVLHVTTEHGPVVVLHFTTDRSPTW